MLNVVLDVMLDVELDVELEVVLTEIIELTVVVDALVVDLVEVVVDDDEEEELELGVADGVDATPGRHCEYHGLEKTHLYPDMQVVAPDQSIPPHFSHAPA